ncbi:MAG: hypothetical protein V4469_04350 [Patescibacteria group bacterium]
MLQEQDKIKLDNIVKQMVANKEPDSNIQLVVNDFKQKYSKQAPVAQSAQSEQPGFIDNLKTGVTNIVKDITGVEKNKSDAFIPSLIRNTIGSSGLAGIAQLPGKVLGALSEYAPIVGTHSAEKLYEQSSVLSDQANKLFIQARTETDPNKKADLIARATEIHKNALAITESANKIGESTNTTGGQALGTTANAALTTATAGTGSAAEGAVTTGLAKYGGGLTLKTLSNVAKIAVPAAKVAENAAIGVGFQAANNLQNEKPITQDLGTAGIIGAAIPALGTAGSKIKNAVLEKATPAAELFINSLIKPLQKDFAYGKNPAQGILKEGIVANNFDDLSQKVSEKISEVGGKIGEVGQKLDQSGQISLNLTPALVPIDEAIQTAAKSNNQTLFHSLQNVKIALIHDLKVGVDEGGKPAIIQGDAKNLVTAGYNEAKQFLSDIAEHTRFTGNVSDDKALNMATKRAYGITRDLMNRGADAVDPALGKEIRSLNERYGDLLSARSAINHRDIVMKRQNLLSLADKFSIPVSIASSMMTGFATGDWSKAGTLLAGQLTAIAAGKALSSTAAKTRVAQFLSRLAPEERQGILNSTPALKNFYERLTGQTTPGPDAPKTKTLQTIEDYIKNPKLGLSIDNITKNISTAEKGTLRDFTDYVNGAYKPDEKTLVNLKRDAQEIADKYGFTSAAKSDKSLASQIGQYLDSIGFDKRIKK